MDVARAQALGLPVYHHADDLPRRVDGSTAHHA
jgi:NAD-dependent oxidoreductase involved in siderophore biosynthesis